MDTIYFPPNSRQHLISHFKNKFKNMEKCFEKYVSVLIFGDFNLNFLSNDSDFLSKNAHKLSLTFSNFGFKQVINKFTYSTNTNSICQKSLIYLLFINNSSILKNVEIVDNISKTCDHFAIYSILNLPKKEKQFIEKQVPLYSEENLNKLNEELFSLSWEDLTVNSENIDDVLYYFIK